MDAINKVTISFDQRPEISVGGQKQEYGEIEVNGKTFVGIKLGNDTYAKLNNRPDGKYDVVMFRGDGKPLGDREVRVLGGHVSKLTTADGRQFARGDFMNNRAGEHAHKFDAAFSKAFTSRAEQLVKQGNSSPGYEQRIIHNAIARAGELTDKIGMLEEQIKTSDGPTRRQLMAEKSQLQLECKNIDRNLSRKLTELENAGLTSNKIRSAAEEQITIKAPSSYAASSTIDKTSKNMTAENLENLSRVDAEAGERSLQNAKEQYMADKARSNLERQSSESAVTSLRAAAAEGAMQPEAVALKASTNLVLLLMLEEHDSTDASPVCRQNNTVWRDANKTGTLTSIADHVHVPIQGSGFCFLTSVATSCGLTTEDFISELRTKAKGDENLSATVDSMIADSHAGGVDAADSRVIELMRSVGIRINVHAFSDEAEGKYMYTDSRDDVVDKESNSFAVDLMYRKGHFDLLMPAADLDASIVNRLPGAYVQQGSVPPRPEIAAAANQ